jgi:putative cofactor-binding repeat protein
LSATQLNATTTVAGSFVYSPTAGTVLNVGSQTLSVTFTPADTTDYTTATQTVTFVVNPAPLVSIAVSPANPSIAKGLSQQFTAIGTYSDSSTQNLTNSVTWSSSSPAVATISAKGLAQSLATGSTTIQAISGSVTSNATLFTVTAATLASIVVTPANPSIAKGLTQQFTAIGTYTDSSTKNLTSSVTWASSVETTATISSGGLATALSTTIPITKISAISGTILGSTTLTVTPATLVSIAVTPPNPSIAKGRTQQFTAIGTYTDSSTQNLSNTATWSSSAAAVATIGATGLAQSLATGSTTIKAVSGGVTSNPATLIVSPPALVSIAVTPTNPSIAKGTTQQFTAIGTYTDSSTQNVTNTVTWSTSTPAVATIGATGLAQSLATGSTTIQAVSGGVTGNSATLTVSVATLVSITVTPGNPSIAKGTTQQLAAIGTYTDGSTQNLTSTVTWNSSTLTVATINATGLVQSLITGSTTIQAATSGLTSNPVTLTVTAATLKSIAVTPNAASVLAGNSVQFTALGTYSDNNVQDQTNAVIWTSADTSTATINTAGLVTGVQAGGPVSITAAQGGVSGNAALTVNSSPTISTQPANQTVNEGQTATLMVAVIGTAPFTYQWQRNGTIISGATLSSYTTPPTTAADSGASFAVVVTNSLGNATSNAASLTVNSPPSITSQPSSQTVNAGQTATFTVVATGTPPLKYQWRKNAVNIPGATSSSYTTPAATAPDNGATFDVLVTNVVTTKTSISVTLTVNAPPSITGPPASQTVSVGQTATFMVAVTGGTPLSFQWQANGTNIPGATSSSYTTQATALTDNGTVFTVTASNAAGSALSGPALLTVNPTQPVDVVTYHNDVARTGQNLNETILSPANVNSTAFGKLGFSAVDGRVDAQPLYLSSVAIPGQGIHDVLFVATENDSVYALDSTTGQKLWQVSVVGAGETPSDDHNCAQVSPTIGITSTPVIDRTRGPNGAIYLVAMTKDASGKYFQRIHALDITSGAELFGGPTTIQASVPGIGDNTNGQNVIFNPSQYKERAGLLLVNGVVYTAWASHCDVTPYTGWIMGFSETTLAMTTVLNITPNGSGGGIWMSGAGPAADSSGNVYLAAGNGTFDATLNAGFPSQRDYGNALLKLSTSSGLVVADYFKSATGGNGNTVDLSSGGTLLLPDLSDGTGHVWHLALAAGKDTNLYVIDRDAMGKFNSVANSVHQEIDGLSPGGTYSVPAYFNNTVYYGPVGKSIQAFGINNATLSTTPGSQTAATFLYPGATPSISASGTANAILWAVENNSTAAVLHAYDARNLAIELYNSNQAATNRDQFGPGNKFITPTIANGKVYVGTTNGIAIFGLLPNGPVNSAPSVTTQPTNETVNPGQTATFVVGATGSAPLSFQWQKNGSNISGATFSSYTTPPATVADDGEHFGVVVTNGLGSTTSILASLSVLGPPKIVPQPANQTVLVGEEATFSVIASAPGASPLSYKWQLNGMDIPGASSSSYTTPAATLTDNGEQFTVVVSDALGQTVSIPAALTVLPHSSPTTYYIDNFSGSNLNNGISKDTSLQTAPGMNRCGGNCNLIQLTSGDRLIFKGGVTWNEFFFPFIISASGSPGNPIYFGVDDTWFNGASWSRPVFDLSGAIWTFAPVLASLVHDVTLDGFEIRNELVDTANQWPPRGTISVDGGSSVAIQDVYIHSWGVQNPQLGSDEYPFGGIAFYDGSTGCSVKNSVLDGGIGNDSGTAIYGGASIQGNIIENVPNGILIFDSGADVSGNQVFNISSPADPNARANSIFVSASANVYNNIVHDVAPAASAIYLQSANHGSANTQYVYNNLVWNAGANPPIVINSQGMVIGSTSNQFIYNNTLSAGAAAGCIIVATQYLPATNLSVQNNHCISDQSSSQAWCWNNAGGNFQCGLVTNVVFSNNIFMTTAASASQGYAIGNSFQPSSASAGTVGAGLNLSTSCGSASSSLCADRLGAVRPASASPWDAGTYMYQTSAGIAPSITVQPVSLAVTAGQTATLAVIAAGTVPLNYQWQKNGSNIAGAQSSTYTTPATTVADNGAVYTVVVSNASGSVISSPAVLTVNLTAGQLLASTPSLDFGTIVIGTGATQSLALTNTSDSFVTISNVSVSGAAFSATGLYAGLVLSPGQTVSSAVSFTAQVAGNVPGSIVINSDAGNSPTTISLSGSGTQPPHSVILTWDPSASPVFGYYVYRTMTPFGPYVRLNPTPVTTTQLTDIGILPGQTYIYVVTSVYPNTFESSFSDPIMAVIP